MCGKCKNQETKGLKVPSAHGKNKLGLSLHKHCEKECKYCKGSNGVVNQLLHKEKPENYLKHPNLLIRKQQTCKQQV